jgi:hypothetical protein
LKPDLKFSPNPGVILLPWFIAASLTAGLRWDLAQTKFA